ncbi:hypothetical protein C1H46_020751 [Malus baccata]|uniref:Uncharacterized protein n=1 Tax=Malus baccata TaxID=106549 RepID=A0A540M4L7_MALBA|nr:hypothetical protein C1H46_020751 [Malus baccata]
MFDEMSLCFVCECAGAWALDLSWDIIARFGKQEAMPREFFTDFVKVAQDEGRHFTLLASRLEEMGSFHGALATHDGLWDWQLPLPDLMAHLAIEHCVHKVRGLDVVPTTISQFRNKGDDKTAELLESVVRREEITHCAAGMMWFKYPIKYQTQRTVKRKCKFGYN